MKNGWIWVPVAGVIGLIVGAWGPREELREREKKAAEEKVKAAEEARTSRGAFKSFAQMVNIPDEARRPRRRGQQKRPPKKLRRPQLPATARYCSLQPRPARTAAWPKAF